MNLAQFKDRVSHIYLAGTVVESWSLTQEVAAKPQVRVFSMTNNFVSELGENV